MATGQAKNRHVDYFQLRLLLYCTVVAICIFHLPLKNFSKFLGSVPRPIPVRYNGITGLFLHVGCIPHQNSQRLFWASVCVCARARILWMKMGFIYGAQYSHEMAFKWQTESSIGFRDTRCSKKHWLFKQCAGFGCVAETTLTVCKTHKTYVRDCMQNNETSSNLKPHYLNRL